VTRGIDITALYQRVPIRNSGRYDQLAIRNSGRYGQLERITRHYIYWDSIPCLQGKFRVNSFGMLNFFELQRNVLNIIRLYLKMTARLGLHRDKFKDITNVQWVMKGSSLERRTRLATVDSRGRKLLSCV